MASDDITRQLRRAEYLRQYFAATGREYATGRNVKCPNAAAHAHGDANPSAKVYENPDGALVKCHGCGGKWDIFDLWLMDNGGTFPDAKAALCDLCGITNTPSHANASRAAHTSGGDGDEIGTAHGAAADRVQATPDKQTAAYITQCALTLQGGEDGEAGRAYLNGRGISVETARRFNVGYDPKAGWGDKRGGVVIPYGAGYTVRYIQPQTSKDGGTIKAMFLPKKPQPLPSNIDWRPPFNATAIAEAAKDGVPVFIVEGEIDALSVAECGGVAVAVPTGGVAKIVKAAAKIGRGLYVPCMDRDKAGEAAQGKFVAALREIGGEVCVYEGAPKILMPDAADRTHPKDANESLQRDAAAFRAAVAEVIGKAQAYAKAEEEKRKAEEERHKPYFTFAEFPEPPPEEEDPDALFKGGYLRKDQGAIFAGPAGSGKSTLSLQLALHWVLGDSCLGFEPVRPLNIAVIQSEDDVAELAKWRASIKQGMAAEGYTPERIQEAMGRLHMRTEYIGKRGEQFANALGEMQSKYHYDLVIVNPLKSYFKGDMANNEDANAFFRDWIDPVIKNPATKCGIIFFHHFTKPTRGRDAANYGKGAFAQYCIQGAAELNDWARAVVILLPFENALTYWTLTAAKRWKPLGWTGADGNPTREKDIAYSDHIIYWRVPSADEIAAVKNGATPSRKQETESQREQREKTELNVALKEIADYLTNLRDPIKKSKVYEWCDNQSKTNPLFSGFHSHTVMNKKTGEKYPKRPCFLAYELIIAEPLKYGVGYHVGQHGNGKPYALYGGVAPLTGNTAAQAEPSATTADADGQGADVPAEDNAPDETGSDDFGFEL